MSQPEIQRLVDALRSKDEQLYALLTLNEIEAEIPFTDLLPLLQSQDYFIRKLTLETLARTVNKQEVNSVGPSIVPLIEDENENVRAVVAQTLGTFAYEPAASRLGSLLPKEESAYVRSSIAEALGDIGDAHAITALEKALYDDDEHVRAYAIRSLGLLANSSFAHVFAKFSAQNVLSLELRIEIACANYRIGGGDSLHQFLTLLKHIDDIDNLDRMLSNINDFLERKHPPTLQQDAAQLWSALEDVKGRFADRQMTITGIQSVLGQEKSMSTERIQTLYETLESGEPNKQIASIRELESFQIRDAVPRILPLLHATNVALREQAAHTVGRLASPGADEVGMQLMTLLKDSNELVRYEAAESLGLLHYLSAKEDLRQIMLGDGDWLTRIAATEALGDFGDRGLLSDFQLLFERFGSDDLEEALLLQKSAAEAITHVATREDVALLQHELADAATRPVVRAVLLSSLYALHSPESFEQLLALLRHLENEIDMLSTLRCIFRLTEGDPPPLLQSDIESLLEALSNTKIRAITKEFFQSVVRIDRLQQRLQRVRAGEIIPVKGRDTYCC